MSVGSPTKISLGSRLSAMLALALIAGCGAPRTYMGLDLRGPDKATAVQRLALTAQSGDKAAQLELGARFEAGRGVPEDWERACQLYERAAATTGGTIYVYQPPVGRSPGRVMPISTPVNPGLPQAQARLIALAYRASGAAGAAGCLARHR